MFLVGEIGAGKSGFRCMLFGILGATTPVHKRGSVASSPLSCFRIGNSKE